MTNISDRPTAQILQFPLERRLRDRFSREADQNVLRPAETFASASDSWYHEAAIREDRAGQH